MAGDGAPSGAETQAQSAKRPSGRTTMAGDGGHLGVVAHQSDRGLLEVDQLDARHRPQNVLGGLDHALDPGMAVQRDAHVDAPAQKRPQPGRGCRAGTA